MFLCVSLNPAIDKRLHVERLRPGSLNRVRETVAAPGGKAAHVAMVLRTLGADPVWLGFAGGTTGNALAEGLVDLSIRAEVVPIADSTRENLEIIEDDGTVTEVLEPGPSVTHSEWQRLQACMEDALNRLKEPAIVILSGSLPAGVPCDCYSALTALVHRCRGRAFVDSSGEPLRQAVNASPEFVKPNLKEAEWLSGSTIRGRESAADVLKAVLRAGAAAGAISLGEDGIVSASKAGNHVLWARAPQQDSRFSVGSGDAALAGFAFAAERGLSASEAVRLAAACGAANCLADGPGRAKASDIERLNQQVEIEVLRR